jgi:hypothetical protein
MKNFRQYINYLNEDAKYKIEVTYGTVKRGKPVVQTLTGEGENSFNTICDVLASTKILGKRNIKDFKDDNYIDKDFDDDDLSDKFIRDELTDYLEDYVNYDCDEDPFSCTAVLSIKVNGKAVYTSSRWKKDTAFVRDLKKALKEYDD